MIMMALLIFLVTLVILITYFYYFYILDQKWMMTAGVQYLHMTDDLNITDYKHNLIALWAKCVANSLGYTQYYDGYIIDFLPNYTRIFAKWPLCLIWASNMKKTDPTITRLDLMDLQLLRIFKLCKTEYKYTDLQIVIIGSGFDNKFIKFQNETNKPKHLHFIEIDLPKTINFKKKLVQRLIIRHPKQTIKPPIFIPADLLKSNMKDLLVNKNGFDNKMPTIFIFEAILCYLIIQKKSEIVTQIMNDINDICNDLPNSFMIMFDGVPALDHNATTKDAQEYFNSIGFATDYMDLKPVSAYKMSNICGAFSRIPQLIK
eukprot:453851_1